MDRKEQYMINGYIGVTDEGFPVVTEFGTCPWWTPERGGPSLEERTCWYCRYADFRKTTEVTLAQSVCRHPRNQVRTRFANEP